MKARRQCWNYDAAVPGHSVQTMKEQITFSQNAADYGKQTVAALFSAAQPYSSRGEGQKALGNLIKDAASCL